jgi:hypothetical protein
MAELLSPSDSLLAYDASRAVAGTPGAVRPRQQPVRDPVSSPSATHACTTDQSRRLQEGPSGEGPGHGHHMCV